MASKSVYLVISHISRLVSGANSHIKGVSSNPDNWETFENMVLVDRVSRSRLVEASVVLDLLEGKVVKNRFGASDFEVFREYYDRYQTDIADALRTWGLQSPENYLKLRAVADKIAEKNAGANTDETDPN